MIKITLKKMDEMEKDILFKCSRWGFLFNTIALFIWLGIAFLFKENWFIPLAILSGEGLIVFIAEQLYIRRVGDREWKKNIIVFITLFVIVFIVSSLIPMFE